MTAAQLLVVGLACLAAGLGGWGLLWLDARFDRWDEEEREAYMKWTKGRRA